jgi:cobalt-zinc-cadmium efflux system membrane fusion protein
MKKHIIIYAALAALLAACSSKSKTQASEAKAPESKLVQLTEAQFKNAALEIAKAVQRPMSSSIQLNGSIDVPPQNLVTISAPMGGYLKSTKLLPGMPIRKGEVIAIMEDQAYIELQEQYLSTQAELSSLEAEYNRQKTLFQGNAGSSKNLEMAEANFKTAKIRGRAFSEKLKLIGIQTERLTESNMSRSISIVAPISGFVSKVLVNTGKYVAPTDILFELVDPSDIHLNLKLFEKDLDKVFIGQEITCYSAANPEKKYKAEVLLIGQDIGADRTVEVHCHFKAYDKALVPGMFMTAVAEAKPIQAWTLPDDAIIQSGNTSYCFIAKGARVFELCEIKKGLSHEGYTTLETVSTNNIENQEFVIKNAYTLWMQLNKETEE